MAVLSIGDQFPAYELTAVVPGNLKEVEASKPEDYFTTVSSQVPAGGAAQAHVDAAGVEGGQGGEALGHLERAVVHGHDTTRAHTDAAGGVQDVHHEQVGRRGQEGAGAVVLGQPEAVVAGLLQAAPQADEVPQGLANVSSLEERNLLEDADPAETRTHGFS